MHSIGVCGEGRGNVVCSRALIAGRPGHLCSRLVLAQAFGCEWLSLRSSLVDSLPFAGSEVFVLKER